MPRSFAPTPGARVRSLRGGALDEEGSLLLLCEHGAGVLDDRDLLAASEGLVDGKGRPLPDEAIEAILAEPDRGSIALRSSFGGAA